jgi:hypothetical protein
VHETGASATCTAPIDAAMPDAGAIADASVHGDGGSTVAPGASCGCRAGGHSRPSAWLVLFALALRRRRGATSLAR